MDRETVGVIVKEAKIGRKKVERKRQREKVVEGKQNAHCQTSWRKKHEQRRKERTDGSNSSMILGFLTLVCFSVLSDRPPLVKG